MAASKIGPQLPGCLAGLFIHAATWRNYNFSTIALLFGTAGPVANVPVFVDVVLFYLLTL